MSEEQDPEKYYDPLEPSKESQSESEGSTLKNDAQNYALKKGREALSKTTKPVAGGTGSAVAGGSKAAVSGGATSAAGSMAGDGATNLVGSSAGAASGVAAGGAVSGAGIAGAAVGEVGNLKESISEGDGTGVVDSGVRVAAIAAGTYFGGNAGGAAASAVLNTEVGRQTSRGVSKIIVAIVSFAVLSLLLFMGMSVTIAAAVTQQQRNSNQIQTCRDMAAGVGGPTVVSPQSPSVINTGPNITVIGEDGTADVSEDVSRTVGTCFTSTFSGEVTVPIGGTLQPDGTYARIPGSAISDTYMGHKGRYNGSPGALDIAAPMNTPILAATDGVVLSVTSRELGNGITVQVSPNVKMLYWHAETVFVKPGDNIQAGQQIALVGTTGYSTGPHLHLGVYVDGVDVDPQTFFLPKGINFYEIFGME